MSKPIGINSGYESIAEKDLNSVNQPIGDENSNDQSIIALQEIQDYIKEKKEIYDILVTLLETSDNNEKDFQALITIISQQKQEENQEKIEKLLQLIINIANNCHRHESFFKKIYKIIEYYENQIKQTFSNIEIFNLFESNKKILLFLFKKENLKIDHKIYIQLLSKIESNGNRYCHFFYPEIKNYAGETKVKTIEKELLEKDPNIFDYFEEKREEGHNDTFISSLIRKDSVEDFIGHVTHNNISVNGELISSIFETNSFLIENKKTSLIEYAAFFGSIQIFRYLYMNNAKLKPSLWLYAIHSRNAELIHFLESNKVSPLKFILYDEEENEEEEEDNDDENNNIYLE